MITPTTTNGNPAGTLTPPRPLLAQGAPLAHPLQQADSEEGARA